jgi:DNA polymerase III epsilon subunit-like protein
MRAFLEWAEKAGDKTIAGHVITFDLPFLQFSAARYHLNWTLPKRTLDTHSLAYLHMLERGIEPPFDAEHKHSDLNSDFLFAYVGLSIKRGTHNALEDAKLTAEAVSRLLYNKHFLEDYNEFTIPWKKK